MISVGTVQILKFGEYVRTLHLPTSLNLVKFNPLRGTGLVILDPKLVFALVDIYFGGKGRMTVFATGGRARTMDFETGDVGYVQKTLPHYIENTGTTDLK